MASNNIAFSILPWILKKKVNKKIIMHCVLIIYQMPVLEFMTGEARVLSGKKTK